MDKRHQRSSDMTKQSFSSCRPNGFEEIKLKVIHCPNKKTTGKKTASKNLKWLCNVCSCIKLHKIGQMFFPSFFIIKNLQTRYSWNIMSFLNHYFRIFPGALSNLLLISVSRLCSHQSTSPAIIVLLSSSEFMTASFQGSPSRLQFIFRFIHSRRPTGNEDSPLGGVFWFHVFLLERGIISNFCFSKKLDVWLVNITTSTFLSTNNSITCCFLVSRCHQEPF